MLCLIDHWGMTRFQIMDVCSICLQQQKSHISMVCFFLVQVGIQDFFGDSFVIVAEVDFNLDVPFRIISEWSNESEYRRPILQPVVEPSGKVSVGWFKGKSEA